MTKRDQDAETARLRNSTGKPVVSLPGRRINKLVQPSKAVVPDLERLKEILSVFERHATGAKDLSPRLADPLKMEGSSLLAKVGNAASDNATDRD